MFVIELIYKADLEDINAYMGAHMKSCADISNEGAPASGSYRPKADIPEHSSSCGPQPQIRSSPRSNAYVQLSANGTLALAVTKSRRNVRAARK